MKLEVETGELFYVFNYYINWCTTERLQFPWATAGESWQRKPTVSGAQLGTQCFPVKKGYSRVLGETLFLEPIKKAF